MGARKYPDVICVRWLAGGSKTHDADAELNSAGPGYFREEAGYARWRRHQPSPAVADREHITNSRVHLKGDIEKEEWGESDNE